MIRCTRLAIPSPTPTIKQLRKILIIRSLLFGSTRNNLIPFPLPKGCIMRFSLIPLLVVASCLVGCNGGGTSPNPIGSTGNPSPSPTASHAVSSPSSAPSGVLPSPSPRTTISPTPLPHPTAIATKKPGGVMPHPSPTPKASSPPHKHRHKD